MFIVEIWPKENFVENTTEQICESIIEDTIESIGGNLDFASGYIDGLWSGVTQTSPNSKKYLFSEKAYDEGLVMGNFTVLTADTTMTILSATGTGASATATVAATASGGYVVVPEMVALTAVSATSTTYFAGRAKNDSSRLKDSVDELLDSDADVRKKNRIPDNDSTTGHIFRDAEGHIPDTPENRTLLENVANDVDNFRGKDKYGNEWYTMDLEDGRQVWVESRNGNIFEGGINEIPKTWNPETGLKKP